MSRNFLRKLDIRFVKGDFKNPVNKLVESPDDLSDIYEKIKDKYQETLIAVYLKDNLKPITYDILSLGDNTTTLCSPKQILRHAVLVDSDCFIIIHNHPNGDPQPSGKDMARINRIQEKAVTLDMYMQDFIIVGDLGNKKPTYWSLFQESTNNRKYKSKRKADPK